MVLYTLLVLLVITILLGLKNLAILTSTALKLLYVKINIKHRIQ
jgi:hypothetical protein